MSTHVDALTEAAKPFAANLLAMAGRTSAPDDPGSKAEDRSTDRPGDEPGDDADTAAPEKDETPQIAVAGKVYASEEAQRAAHEAAQAHITRIQGENEQFRQLLMQLAAEKVKTSEAPVEDTLSKEIEALGIPADKIAALIRREASKIADERVAAKVDPLVAAEAAEAHMRASYPGYAENVAKINEFVRADAETQALLMGPLRAGDALTAKMIAFARFVDKNRDEVQAPAEAAAKAAKAARADAKKDAGILPNAKGASRAEAPKDSRERIAQAAQVARKTGNDKAYMTEVVKATFPDLFAYLRTQPR